MYQSKAVTVLTFGTSCLWLIFCIVNDKTAFEPKIILAGVDSLFIQNDTCEITTISMQDEGKQRLRRNKQK